MIGLVDMTMRLAEQRAQALSGGWSVVGFWTIHKIAPCDRAVLNPKIHPVSAEYYRIIDRLSRGEPA